MRLSRWLLLFAAVGSVLPSCGGDDDEPSATGGAGGAQVGGASPGAGSGGVAQAGQSSGGGMAGQSSTGGAAGSSIGGTRGGDDAGGDGGRPAVSGAAGTAGAGGLTAGTAGVGGAGGAGGVGGVGGVGGAGGVDGAVANTCVFPPTAALAKAGLPLGFCAWAWATNVPSARGITVDSAGNALVVSQGSAQVVALWDANGDGVSSADERATIASYAGLNHGIALNGGYLYASRDVQVVRWPYNPNRSSLGTPTVVVDGIPSAGHVTRSLAFDGQYLYVSVGSGTNLDPTSERARIRRFALSGLSATAVPFANGEVFADGLRNEVGIAFDQRGRLWGVENGRDNLARTDLGSDIHNDNPGEELNLFEAPGRFYGYPYCWTEFLLPSGVGLGTGTQWADPATQADGTHTDAWCRNTTNVVPPVLSMQAHSAPLDLSFYRGAAFPREYRGDAFVTFHGSWNRTVPTGYKVMHLAFGTDGMPLGNPTPFLEYAGDGDIAAEWPHRPVSLATLPSGVLLVTSDASSSVLAIGYRP